jgi:molybdopterin molybdotransferase
MKTDISVDEAIACYARIQPVRPKLVALNEAIGLRAANDVRMRRSMPSSAILAIDGWPVASALLAQATRRKPVPLGRQSLLLDSGSALPEGCDAVLPPASVVMGRFGPAAFSPVTPGYGVIDAGGLYAEGETLLKQGSWITMTAAMAGAMCGVNEVMVRRPVVDIIFNAPGITRQDDRLLHVVTIAIRGSGCEIGTVQFTSGEPSEFAHAVQASSADVITTVGGTGAGPSDTTLSVLRDIGEVIFHGVRMQPGGTVALSMVNQRPVFSVPGSLADIIAVNLLLTPPFARRSFGRPERSLTTQEAKLLTPVAASPKQTRLLFATVSDSEITVLGGSELRPLQLAGANAAVVVQEGSRHRRMGEKVAYLRLGNVM